MLACKNNFLQENTSMNRCLSRKVEASDIQMQTYFKYMEADAQVAALHPTYAG